MSVRQRILIVDDEPDTRSALRDLLESEQYVVVEAANAAEALAAAHAGVDAILLDVLLPDRDGVETARALADDPLTRNIPVVLMTAHTAFQRDGQSSSPPNVRRTLFKPCRPRTFLEVISDALSGRSEPSDHT